MYSNSLDQKFRNKIYKEEIGPVLKELIKNVVMTFKFNGLPNIEELKIECEEELARNLGKFDPTKGSTAFAYFTICAKNFFTRQTKKNSKRLRQNISHDDIFDLSNHSNLIIENSYYDDRTKKEYMEALLREMDIWETNRNLNENELRSLKAIKILFNEPDALNDMIFKKRSIFIYLREITRFETKELSNSLKKIREMYKDFRKRWNNERY